MHKFVKYLCEVLGGGGLHVLNNVVGIECIQLNIGLIVRASANLLMLLIYIYTICKVIGISIAGSPLLNINP